MSATLRALVERRAPPPGRTSEAPALGRMTHPSTAPLEADCGAECHAYIVADSVIEVDVVTYFQAQTDGPDESFHAPARIESNFGIAVAHRAQSTLESLRRVLVIGGEADEPGFSRNEKARSS